MSVPLEMAFLVIHITCHIMNYYYHDRLNACTDIYVCAIENLHNLLCMNYYDILL